MASQLGMTKLLLGENCLREQTWVKKFKKRQRIYPENCSKCLGIGSTTLWTGPDRVLSAKNILYQGSNIVWTRTVTHKDVWPSKRDVTDVFIYLCRFVVNLLVIADILCRKFDNGNNQILQPDYTLVHNWQTSNSCQVQWCPKFYQQKSEQTRALDWLPV